MSNRVFAACVSLALAAFLWQYAEAYTFQASAQKGTTTFQANGVSGPVGYLGDETISQDQRTVSALYGSTVGGESCDGNDNKSEDNNLEVKITWQQGDADPTTITARARMTDRNYFENNAGITGCPQGPPSWSGTATVTLSKPGVGTGGGSGTAGAWTANLGGGTQSGSDLNWVSMDPYNWDVDPNDPGTHVKFVSAKVTASLNGTVVECKVDSQNKAKCHLEVVRP